MKAIKSMSQIIAEMGIVDVAPQDPIEIVALASELGIELSEEEAAMYSIDVRRMSMAREACERCTGLEACGSDPVGYETVLSRSSHGAPHFAIRPCQRRVQYEEMMRSEALLASSRIPHSLRAKSYRGFDPAENEMAARVAAEIIRDDRRKGVVYYGPTGVGKTHLAAAILNNRILSGRTGIYATVPELMDDLRSAMRTNTIEEARAAIIETNLLFLDDMGTENPSEFVVEEMFKIINGRLLRSKQIIATTNLSPDGFRERYAGVGGSRIVSRLYEACEWVEVSGRDRRL